MEKNNLTVPVAIIIAGALVAGAVFLKGGSQQTPTNANTAAAAVSIPKDLTIAPISPTDHIRGNPNADIILVEYSDLECPYCKVFQVTMNQIMTDLGKDGSVAWVYRHFPLYKPDEYGRSLHAKAGKEAEASECVAELGGEDNFWKFIDKIYEITPSNNPL
ncbi:DsbA family protein, partial [Candidatus Parcubacteria bacterium]|nr:DsbA family protein [Candidatus Parcubacteria bacterium]